MGSTTTPYRALTVMEPWGWLIAKGYKDMENRDWSTQYRGKLLIHASKRLDLTGFLADGSLWKLYWMTQRGATRDMIEAMPQHKDLYQLGGIIGIADLVDVVSSTMDPSSPWFHGRYGFVLTNARPLPFLKLRGQLGLFTVSDQIIEQVEAAVALQP